MRTVQNINEGWQFHKQDIGAAAAATATGESVNLPHTWNAVDGQDGGNDYHRGTCWYTKQLAAPLISAGGRAYLEFRGANSSAEVYLNGARLCRHDGGYSAFRVDITDALAPQNTLVVGVNNAKNDTVYPQKADFTFYGGIYRDIYLVVVPQNHFDLEYYGGPGLQVTPRLENGRAVVGCKAWVKGAGTVRFAVGGAGEAVATVQNGVAEAEIVLENPRLWQGRKDPYLYTLTATLTADGETDEIYTRFGCRSFGFDKDAGFILNGESRPLRGVSRHQDFRGVGNAIIPEMQRRDMELIAEMGANTIRLAHYQHDQYFYDLCDEYGMCIWVEIPYISEHMPAANANTQSQLRELIAQSYNHPSIICWGLSNEITVTGFSEDLYENHLRLNEIAHEMDATRPTVTANVFMLETDSKLLDVPDILSYNLYYGWYLGELADNDRWFDTFHAKYPDKIIGLSEYGADANPKFQTNTPERSDYSEQYQALYHEHMLRMITARPYIWATHVWNMFDFGADGREEGGNRGVNQKGLVTFDRQTKKDAFYLYKAYLSEVPFLHLCGRRYVDRHEDVTTITVYTNQPEVALYCDGALVARQTGDKVFRFELPITGGHTIEAKSGALADCIRIRKVAQRCPEYILADGAIVNWFEVDGVNDRDGYFSIKNTIGEVMAVPEAAAIYKAFQAGLVVNRGDVAKNVKHSEEMVRMMMATPIERMLKQLADSVTIEDVVALNQALNGVAITNLK